MPRARVVMNVPAMVALRKEPGVVAELTSRMQHALAAAKATAPVGPEKGSTHYVDSLRIEHRDRPSRAAVILAASVPYALRVEANHGTLSRALDEAGGERAEKQPKWRKAT